MKRMQLGGLWALAISLAPAAAVAEAALQPVRLVDTVVVTDRLSLTTSVRVQDAKDLMLTVELEAAVVSDDQTRLTRTRHGGVAPTAELVVEVSVDGRPGSALPDRVVFHRAGVGDWTPIRGLSRRCPTGAPGAAVHLSECGLSSAELGQVNAALSPQRFDFVLPWVARGVHTVEVSVRLEVTADRELPPVRAVVGRGEFSLRPLHLARGDG